MSETLILELAVIGLVALAFICITVIAVVIGRTEIDDEEDR